MISNSEMQLYVDKINQQLPVHSFYDGFQIRLFKKNNLVISGSQDWVYYHNIDLIFKKVIFFNLPAIWRDTEVRGDTLFRLSNFSEFKNVHPDFNPENYHIFAIDLHNDFQNRAEKHTYFVVARNVFFEELIDPIGDGIIHYKDPFELEGVLWKNNRIIKK